MNDKDTGISDKLGCISLYLAALSTLTAGVVVSVPGLIPVWVSWGLTLGGGLLALVCAVSSLSLHMIQDNRGLSNVSNL